MPSCSVKWCVNHTSTCSFKSNKGVSFHRFPKDEDMRKKWVEAVRLERRDPWWTSTKASRICSMHFKESDMSSTLCKVNVLSKTAVPICTMVRYETKSKVLSSTHNVENAISYTVIRKTSDTDRSHSKMLIDSKINLHNDNDIVNKELDNDIEKFEITESQDVNESQDVAVIDTKANVNENRGQEKYLAPTEINTKNFTTFDKKDTFIKLNENTSVIVKENQNKDLNNFDLKHNYANIVCQVKNNNTCESNKVIIEELNIFENKETNVSSSDKSETELCIEEIKNLDLNFTFVGKILKTYLPKRKNKQPCDEIIPEVYGDIDDNNDIVDDENSEHFNSEMGMQNSIKGVSEHYNELQTNNMFIESRVEIEDELIDDTETNTDMSKRINPAICEEFITNKYNVNDGKESENTDFNELDSHLVENNVNNNDINIKAKENIYMESSRELYKEPNLGIINKDSNIHLILDLDTNLYTETNTIMNGVDSSKEYCELNNEKNYELVDVTKTPLITNMQTDESMQINNNANTLMHINDLSLIDNEPLSKKSILESKCNVLTEFNLNAAECNQNSVVGNDNRCLKEHDIFNPKISENIEIGLENLQFEVELTSPLDSFQQNTLKQMMVLDDIESPLNINNMEDIRESNVPKMNEEFHSINIVDGVKVDHNQNKEVESQNHPLKKFEIRSNYQSDKGILGLCNVDANFQTLHTKNDFPELIKHLSARPKVDTLAKLCINTLTEIDKKIFSKYGDMALANKKRLQGMHENNDEERNESIDFEVANIVTVLENIDVGEGTELNVTDPKQVKSNLDDNMEIRDGTDSNIGKKILKQEFIASSDNVKETKSSADEITELMENDLLTIPEEMIRKINENIVKGLSTDKDLGKLCGKFCLDFGNESPISGDEVVDDDMEVIESNLDIDKENTSELDFSLLLGDSLQDAEMENVDNNSNNSLDCNENCLNGELMDLRSNDIPESIDGILDEEGSLFENLDLLENGSLGSFEDVNKECNLLNVNKTKNIEEPFSQPHCHKLLKNFSNDILSDTGNEKFRNGFTQFESKTKELTEECLDESSIETDIISNHNKLEKFKRQSGEKCYSLKKPFDETLEQHSLNIGKIKKQLLDQSYEQKTKEFENNLINNQLQSFQLNRNQSCDLKIENNINLQFYPIVNNSRIEISDPLKGPEKDEMINDFINLSDVLFKSNVTSIIKEMESQDGTSSIKEDKYNKIVEAPTINKIDLKKRLYFDPNFEQGEELFSYQNVHESIIDEIPNEICKPRAAEEEIQLSGKTKADKKNNNKKEICTKSKFKEISSKKFKIKHNECLKALKNVNKGKYEAPFDRNSVQSEKLSTARSDINVEQLKRDIFGQCFSSDCGHNCMNEHRKTPKNKIHLLEQLNSDIPNQTAIKKRQRRLSVFHRKHCNLSTIHSLKQRKNQHNCETNMKKRKSNRSSNKEKLKLKYKEFSIDLLKGQCFEFSQKENADEPKLSQKEFKRKCSEPALEQRKMQCTESIKKEDKFDNLIDIHFKKNDTIGIETRTDNCTKSNEVTAECPECGYVTNDDSDVNLSIPEPLSVINKDMLLSDKEKKSNGNNENCKVPLRSVYAMELAYVTAIQALQRKLKHKVAVCDYRLRKMNNLTQINNTLMKANISSKCNTHLIQNKI